MPGSFQVNAHPWLQLDARILRRSFRRTAISLRHGTKVLAESPVLFANSFPKSGTHLLTQILAGFSRIGPAVVSGLPAVVTFRGDTGSQRTESEILEDLNRLLPGDIAYGHIHAFPEAVNSLLKSGFAAYFILRDPRDVAVSHVHYLTSMAPKHVHHTYYHDELKDFDSRLLASIQGVPVEQLRLSLNNKAENEPLPLPDVRSRFEPYLDWLDHPQILTLRYEEFLVQLKETLTRILEHAVERGFKPWFPHGQAIEMLIQGIDPSRSPTFRSGKSGGWREAFNAMHKQVFKEVSGDLLIRLGYEKDQSW